jgi:hypothetical protein
MKLQNLLMILTFLTIIIPVSATQLNGRILIINNSNSNYKILLQVNTDTESQKMGGATFVIKYDTTLLSYPDNPENGIDFIFNNFNLGFYDTAKVTKVVKGKIWLNIDLTSDGHGTTVQKGPNSWTDLVELNFVSSNEVPNNAILWKINDKFWHVYDSDNSTTWDNGNFDLVTSIENENQSGSNISYQLCQNFPNPFNPTTAIQYYLPERNTIKLVIYNTIGQEVAVIVDGVKEAGTYNIDFNASELPSGIYFYRLQAGSFIQTKKMVLLK